MFARLWEKSPKPVGLNFPLRRLPPPPSCRDTISPFFRSVTFRHRNETIITPFSFSSPSSRYPPPPPRSQVTRKATDRREEKNLAFFPEKIIKDDKKITARQPSIFCREEPHLNKLNGAVFFFSFLSGEKKEKKSVWRCP